MLKMIYDRIKIPLFIFGFIWAIELFNMVTDNSLNKFGIIPRSLISSYHLFFSPFIHASLSHIISNTLAFLPIAFLLNIHNPKKFIAVFFSLIILTGIFTWLFGAPNSIHIGLSSVIFGFLGYIISTAFYKMNKFYILMALFVLFAYAGTIFSGLIPQQSISFAGHFGGLVSGLILGKFMR